MRAYLVFTGSGPILMLTTYPDITDQRLIEKLAHKGIAKFLAYEVPLDRARSIYGGAFTEIAADLSGVEDVRVLDFNGHHVFASFRLSDLGDAIRHGD